MIHLWWICCKTVRTNARRQTSKWKARNDIENCDQRLNQINFDHYSWGLLFLDLHECVTVCRSSNKPTQRWLLSSNCCVYEGLLHFVHSVQHLCACLCVFLREEALHSNKWVAIQFSLFKLFFSLFHRFEVFLLLLFLFYFPISSEKQFYVMKCSMSY